MAKHKRSSGSKCVKGNVVVKSKRGKVLARFTRKCKYVGKASSMPKSKAFNRAKDTLKKAVKSCKRDYSPSSKWDYFGTKSPYRSCVSQLMKSQAKEEKK